MHWYHVGILRMNHDLKLDKNELQRLYRSALTCRALPQLLVFLFPPLPGFEDASQAGQLAVAANGWSADRRHHTTRVKGSRLLHDIYNRELEKRARIKLSADCMVILLIFLESTWSHVAKALIKTKQKKKQVLIKYQDVWYLRNALLWGQHIWVFSLRRDLL